MQINKLQSNIQQSYKNNDKVSSIDNQIKNMTKQIQTLNKQIQQLQNQNKSKNKDSKADTAVNENSMAAHQNNVKDQIEEIEEQIANINQQILKLQSEKNKQAVENKNDSKEENEDSKIIKCGQTMRDAKIQYSAKKKLDRKIKEAESQIAIDKAKGYDITADEKELSKLIKTNDSLQKMISKSLKTTMKNSSKTSEKMIDEKKIDASKNKKHVGSSKEQVSDGSDEDLKGNFLDDKA